MRLHRGSNQCITIDLWKRVASFLCMNKNILTRACWYCGRAYYIGEEGGCGNSACAATLVSYLLMGMVTLAPLFNSTNCNEFRVPHDCIMQVCAHNETMDTQTKHSHEHTKVIWGLRASQRPPLTGKALEQKQAWLEKKKANTWKKDNHGTSAKTWQPELYCASTFV